MKRIKSSPKTEESIEILKTLAKRVEEAVVDIHESKRDLKFMKLKLTSVEHNTEIMKVDMEKMRSDVDEIKKEIKSLGKETTGIIDITAEILEKMVTQKELKDVSRRVEHLELMQKSV